MDYVYISIAAICWYNNYELFCKEGINNKISSNIISGFHCLSVLMFHIIPISNSYSYIQNVSMGYYIYDCCVCIINTNNLNILIMQLFHHISTMVFLCCDPNIYMFQQLFICNEMGNLSLYPAYHYLQYGDTRIANKWMFIQKITYVPIHTIIFGYYIVAIFNNINQNNGDIKIWYMLIGVYIIGIYRSIRMLNQSYKY